MEKPGNWFAIAKIWKETSEEKKIKKTACIFTYDFTLGQFSVSTSFKHLVSPYAEHRLEMHYSKQLIS